MVLLPEEPQIIPAIVAAGAARLADQVLEVAHARDRAIRDVLVP